MGVIGTSYQAVKGTASWATGDGPYGKAFRRGFAESYGWNYDQAGKGKFMSGWKAAGKFGKAMHLLGPAGAAFSMYQGYQEGGVLGAAGAGVEWGLWGSAFRMLGVAAPTIGGIAAAGLGVGAATYGAIKYQKNAVAYNKRLRRDEFVSGNIQDPFGNMATIRRRSIQALHNSNMGGRISLGREAQLLGARGPISWG